MRRFEFARSALALLGLGLMTAVAAAPRPIDNRALADEADGTNWAAFGRTFSANHYSPLAQINDGNVAKLALAWSYDIPPVPSVFTEPLAVDGVLYFAVGLSVVHAMDAKTGKLLWQYDPEIYKTAGEKMRVSWAGVRGIAYWQGKVYTGTSDGRLIALDAKTGKPIWSVQTLKDGDGRYVSGAPWVFNGKVVIGHGGADFNLVRGYVTAYDAETGKQAWRFYTVPGDPAKGFENSGHGDGRQDVDRRMVEVRRRRHGLERHGLRPEIQPSLCRHRQRLRRGTRKFAVRAAATICSCARSSRSMPSTGEYVWHYQINPGETWDFNAAMDIELADLEIDGKRRKVLMQAPKNGFFYVIDRTDGKLISAEKFAPANWAERIDLKTGRPVENPAARYADGKPFVMYPGPVGAHTVQAMSFSPRSGLVYIPTNDIATVYSDPPGELAAWRPKPGMVINNGIGKMPADIKLPPSRSWLQAWDPVRQRKVWEVPLTGALNGGTAATAGNLVFQGQGTGEFNAYAADTGAKLWSFDAQAGVIAQPITYSVDGKQYVTVLAGWRGPGGTRPVEWDYYTQPRRVLTFTLDGAAKLPVEKRPVQPFADDPAFVVDTAKAALGKEVFATRCFLCHGSNVVSGGTAPDLRRAAIPLSLDALKAVLHDGLLMPRGMPQYQELPMSEIEGLQHYIRQRARESIAAQLR